MNLILKKDHLTDLLNTWRGNHEVYAPQSLQRFTHFLPLPEGSEPVFDQAHNTRIPPKALFLLISEALLKFTRFGGYEQVPSQKAPRLIFGIRPCDARALTLLDTVFKQERYTDPHWQTRRDATVLVGLGCHEPCQTGFCTTVGSGPFDRAGLDAILTDLGEEFLVETLTEKGECLFTQLKRASDEQNARAMDLQQAAKDNMPTAFEVEGLKQKLDANFASPYWEEISRSCLGCGVCTFLCPTCFCFDIVDEAQRGERVRNWDTCMFRTYSLEASGHNPRPSHVERTRQRLSHKYSYWVDQISQIGCTGCGRCVRYCPVGLDIRAMLRKAQQLPSEVLHAK